MLCAGNGGGDMVPDGKQAALRMYNLLIRANILTAATTKLG